jgi:hypothetical protein
MKHKSAGLILCSLILVFTLAAVISIATGGNKDKPKAQGTVTSVPDTDQFFDPSVPVGILRVTSIAEPKKPYKPEQVVVENRIQKIGHAWPAGGSLGLGCLSPHFTMKDVPRMPERPQVTTYLRALLRILRRAPA